MNGLNNTKYKKKPENPFKLSATFIVTDDCNLRCRYCYEEKKDHHRMPLEVAKQGVDFILKNYGSFPGVNWEFIGGEPFMEIDLISEITEYIREAQKDHKYADNYLFGFSTNGTLFGDEKVRNYLTRDRRHMSVGLSLDGCKTIHDYNRNNSFCTAMKYFNWWRRNFPWCSTKSTLNREALPYIEESIRFMIDNLKLEYIYMNTVYEDIWQPSDPALYYEQLIKVADFLIEDNRYQRHYVSLFDEFLTMKIENNHGWCGTGNSMVAIDWEGKVYPCLRFQTLSKRELYAIGDVWGGIDLNRLKPFKYCHNLRDDACTTCDIKSGCGHCKALDFDVIGNLFTRVKYCCEMHKARRKANDYFFNRIRKIESGDNL